MDNQETKQEKKNIKLEILEKMATLVTAGFALVAALAWNDAIKKLFEMIFGKQSNVFAMFGYAILITVIVVFATIKLGRATRKAKDEISKLEGKISNKFKKKSADDSTD